VSASSSTTVDVVAPPPFTGVDGTGGLARTRLHSAAVLQLRRALDVVADVGTLVLLTWLVPFVILAIASPIVIVLWAALALVHML
jgi:hypothetical protein